MSSSTSIRANDLKKLAGSAVFACNYGFKRHGFCNAIYQLSGGTLVAAGPLDFNASNFSLVITGGTGKYRSVAGEVVAMPSSRAVSNVSPSRSADDRRRTDHAAQCGVSSSEAASRRKR